MGLSRIVESFFLTNMAYDTVLNTNTTPTPYIHRFLPTNGPFAWNKQFEESVLPHVTHKMAYFDKYKLHQVYQSLEPFASERKGHFSQACRCDGIDCSLIEPEWRLDRRCGLMVSLHSDDTQ